ncbi:MAG: hypothetical protein HY040_12985 [Planctomycetes bacterium]|nr:hypothetical protein [Planctomycetota bacterium]
MNEPHLFGFIDLTAPVFFVLRVAAGIGAAMVGWFATGPVVRLLYRLAFQRGVPNWVLPWSRLVGAVLCGLLVYYFLPLGGGNGWGWGAGAGGGPGRGPGDGSGQTSDQTKKDAPAKDNRDKSLPAKTVREPVAIELIGGDQYKGDEKYYLLKRQPPAVSLTELEAYFKNHKDRLEVHIVLTPNSVGEGQGALRRLKDLADTYRIPTVRRVEENKPKQE